MGNVTTYYVGNHYEVKNSVVTKYYFAASTRLAVRTGGTLSFLLSDHLGSSSVTTNASGVKTASALYKAFGESRFSSGNLGTDYRFTGQREEASLGIYFFQARWYDGALGRFLSPDSIVPTGSQGTQAWDRYAFVNNNPVKYTDPTGHWMTQDDGGGPDTCTDPVYCLNGAPARLGLIQARKVFNDMADESDIAFDYPEGCYARADIMTKRILARYGITVNKVWAIADPGSGNVLSVDSPYGPQTWASHVAPIITTVNADGSTDQYVIDPSLAEKPVPIAAWLHMMDATTRSVDVQVTAPGEAPEGFPGTGYWLDEDPYNIDEYSAAVMKLYQACSAAGISPDACGEIDPNSYPYP